MKSGDCLPFLLTDCASRDWLSNELFIAQGLGLHGTIRRHKARNRMTQAVLCNGDWKLTVERAGLHAILDSDGAKSVIAALGVGIHFPALEDLFNLDRLRYGKVIIVLRPNRTGRRTRRQLVAFLYRFMKPLLESGRVYTVDLPKGKLTEELVLHWVLDDSTRALQPVMVGKSLAQTLRVNGCNRTR